MKNLPLLVLIVSVTLIAGCDQTTVQNNTSIPAESGARNATVVSPTPANADNKPAANATPSSETDEGLNSDFEGTSGIIDKKYQISGAALLTAVRTARQENFDRIVFEFQGPEMPGYHLEYIDKPVRACGSGHVVPLKGDGWLQIKFYPANAHTDEGQPTVKVREMSPNHPIVKELKSTCDFEAEVEWVAGVSSPNHYRILELKNPTRLAVDIKHK
jgi:hypothetical protein